MKDELRAYTDIWMFIDATKEHLQMTKSLSAMSHPYSLDFNLKTNGGRSIGYKRQACIMYDDKIQLRYEDKLPIYVNTDCGERVEESEIIGGLREDIIEKLEEKGVSSKEGNLELIASDKSSVNL